MRPGVGCVESKISEGMPRVSGPTMLVDFVFRRMATQSWRTILRRLRCAIGYRRLVWTRFRRRSRETHNIHIVGGSNGHVIRHPKEPVLRV